MSKYELVKFEGDSKTNDIVTIRGAIVRTKNGRVNRNSYDALVRVAQDNAGAWRGTNTVEVEYDVEPDLHTVRFYNSLVASTDEPVL